MTYAGYPGPLIGENTRWKKTLKKKSPEQWYIAKVIEHKAQLRKDLGVLKPVPRSSNYNNSFTEWEFVEHWSHYDGIPERYKEFISSDRFYAVSKVNPKAACKIVDYTDLDLTDPDIMKGAKIAVEQDQQDQEEIKLHVIACKMFEDKCLSDMGAYRNAPKFRGNPKGDKMESTIVDEFEWQELPDFIRSFIRSKDRYDRIKNIKSSLTMS